MGIPQLENILAMTRHFFLEPVTVRKAYEALLYAAFPEMTLPCVCLCAVYSIMCRDARSVAYNTTLGFRL